MNDEIRYRIQTKTKDDNIGAVIQYARSIDELKNIIANFPYVEIFDLKRNIYLDAQSLKYYPLQEIS